MAGPEPESGGRRFVLERLLGEGSYGTVYLAELASVGGFRRRVALKVLSASWDAASDAGRRFRDEARILGRIEHRNIVRVDDLLRIDGRWAIVMEYVDGADLERIFETSRARGRPLPPRAVAEIGAAVAAALDAGWGAPGEDGQPLHAIHRDIKPSNVRLARGGEVKVLDFGVARARFDGREAQTERIRYGSLGYMAPERFLGEDDLPEGDVYGLGVVLFELASLETYGRAELGMDKQAEQVERARATVAERTGSADLADLVARMLAYAPADRPSPPAVRDALAALAAGLPGPDLAAFARERLPELAPPDPSGDPARGRVLEEQTSDGRAVASATLVVPPPPEPPAASSRFPLRAVAVVLGTLLLLGGLVAWFATRPSGPERKTRAPGIVDASEPAAPAPPADAAPLLSPALAPTATVEAGATATPPAPVPPAPTVETSPRTKAPPRAAATGGAIPTGGPAAGAPDGGGAVAPVESAPGERTTTTSAGPTLRAVKFTLAGAEGLRVACGGVQGSGATSALLRDVPAGECVVATDGGLRAVFRVEEPRAVACTADGGTLTCR